MSVVHFLGGAVGYLGLLGALALSMTSAARHVARLVRVVGFRWFQELPVPVAWWRLLAVRFAAAVAPLGVAIGLSWASFFISGIPKVTTRVEVLAGPARQAGMRDGDRIVSIDDERIATWEQLRAVAHGKQGLTRVGVERGGSQIELTITPRAGRLGLGPYYETEKLSLSAALVHGMKLPFVIVGESARGLPPRPTHSSGSPAAKCGPEESS